MASTSFDVTVVATKAPFKAMVYLRGKHWNVLEQFQAGGTVSGLHLRLIDQRGADVAVGGNCEVRF